MYKFLIITLLLIFITTLLHNNFISCSSIAIDNDILSNSIESNSIHQYYYDGECHLPDELVAEIQGYQSIVNKIIKNIVSGPYKGDTWNSLAEMTDKFGSRIAGSENLENAIDYMVGKLNQAGLENVHTENATVLNWVRGYEKASLIKPRKTDLNILGLGTTVGTPRGGIIASAIVVESFEEFDKLPANKVKGKIVVFVPKWVSYGVTVEYRSRSAAVAAKKGAVAALIRSVTPKSMNTPHTGLQHYEDGVKKIPAACITVEDAYMLLRMQKRGWPIQIKLEMEDRNMPPVTSRNTIGELRGTKPDSSVVVVSGHFDSWDVGVGAMDDGGGAFIAWKAVEYLQKLKLRPKRTIRTILWTGEEQGYLGAVAYREAHMNTAKTEFNFFMESDIGTFTPRGIDFTGNQDSECVLREVVKLMSMINATEFATPSDGGPDISVWFQDGFPGASLLNKNDEYFWYHHSAADRMEVEDPVALDKCTALWAAVSYIIADLSIEMPKDLTLL